MLPSWVWMTLSLENQKLPEIWSILKAGVHLRSESDINVENWGLPSVQDPESSLGEFWGKCQRAPLTLVSTVHPDIGG